MGRALLDRCRLIVGILARLGRRITEAHPAFADQSDLAVGAPDDQLAVEFVGRHERQIFGVESVLDRSVAQGQPHDVIRGVPAEHGQVAGGDKRG